jgi:hypothetical protein
MARRTDSPCNCRSSHPDPVHRLRPPVRHLPPFFLNPMDVVTSKAGAIATDPCSGRYHRPAAAGSGTNS